MLAPGIASKIFGTEVGMLPCRTGLVDSSASQEEGGEEKDAGIGVDIRGTEDQPGQAYVNVGRRFLVNVEPHLPVSETHRNRQENKEDCGGRHNGMQEIGCTSLRSHPSRSCGERKRELEKVKSSVGWLLGVRREDS
eukprot:1790821-Rhodomonas_salina.2